MQTATQPLGAPGAGIATQPVQAPGSFPEVQPTGDEEMSAASDSEADQLSTTSSLGGDTHKDRSADREASKDDPAPEPTEEGNSRETMRGVRSFMNWHRVPEFETVSSTADDNLFAGACTQPTGIVSVKLPASNSPSKRATPPGTLASSRIISSKPLDHLDGTGCMLRTMRVQQYASGHRTRPNSTTHSAGLPEGICPLLHPPGSSAKNCSDAGNGQHVNRQ